MLSPLSTFAVKPELAAAVATSDWAVIGVAEVFVGRDTIADARLQFFEFRKTSFGAARPHLSAVHPHFEHAATARHQCDLAEFIGEREQQFLRQPRSPQQPAALRAEFDLDSGLVHMVFLSTRRLLHGDIITKINRRRRGRGHDVAAAIGCRRQSRHVLGMRAPCSIDRCRELRLQTRPQHVAVDNPGGSCAVPPCIGGQRHGSGRQHTLVTLRSHQPVGAESIRPPIHFADARIYSGQHTRCAAFAINALRERRQRRHRHHRNGGAEGDALRHARRDAQTREGPRATAKSHGVEFERGKVCDAQKFIDLRLYQQRMLARRQCVTLAHRAVERERGGTGLGGGSDGEQFHRFSSVVRCVPSSGAGAAKKRRTSSSVRVRGIAGKLLRNSLPYGLVVRRGSHYIKTPRSSPSRISRPTPCFSAIAACGNCESRNGSPPRRRSASSRACKTGSPGDANGSLSMITTDSASPRTSTPSQKLLVPSSTALPSMRKRCSSSRRGAVPCTSSGYGSRSRCCGAASCRARWLVHSKKARPPLASSTGSAAAVTAAV